MSRNELDKLPGMLCQDTRDGVSRARYHPLGRLFEFTNTTRTTIFRPS